MNDAPGGAPRVSVVVRTKDRPQLLAEALSSLRAQTIDDFETIVVNDGGPLLPSLLSPAPGRRLAVVVPPPPGGRTRALNAGLEAASGRYVAYLDDDDLYRPDHLATLVAFLDGVDGYGAAFTSVEQVGQTLGPDGAFHDAKTRFVFDHPFDPARIVFKNDVPLIGLMHRRELAEAIGGFDTAFELFEDWDFLIRLSRATRLHHLPVVTAVYRIRDDGSNATMAAPWLGERAQAARRALFAKHAALWTPEATMAFIDGLDRETWTARGEIARLSDGLLARGREMNEARERALRLEADLEALKNEARERALRLEADLEALKVDAARAAEIARDREGALRDERDALARSLDEVHRSLWWRLGTPWWALKGLLKR